MSEIVSLVKRTPIAFNDGRSYWEKVCVGIAFGVPTFVERVKHITDLTPEQGACLAGFEAVMQNAAGGDGHSDRVHKFKYWPKLDALDRLAEHLGLRVSQVLQEIVALLN